MNFKLFLSKSIGFSILLMIALTAAWFTTDEDKRWFKPTKAVEDGGREEEDDDEDPLHQWNKIAPWSAEDAVKNQELLEKYGKKVQSGIAPPPAPGPATFANGQLYGEWANRGPYNMPGAFKFADMLDGTDTIYGVTHNHYANEFNARSYIFKGTVYNPKTGTQGDDFVRLTPHWPNRYQDMMVYKYNGKTRILAAIENSSIYYSDDDGASWTQSNGLSGIITSTVINRQDNNTIYSTDGTSIFKSIDGGESFSVLQSFGSFGDAKLYTPRYAIQSNASNVYLAREGQFYTLTTSASSFTLNGSFSGSHNDSHFTIGGDSRKLYVTVGRDYWNSTNGGTSWTQTYPNGNYYGDKAGDFPAGKYLAAHPEAPDTVIGGYASPVFSHDGLVNDISTSSGWGRYQNGNGLSKEGYYDQIRFNYHPDIQSSHFFYNASDDLLGVIATDGGMFMTYQAWTNASNSVAPDNATFYDQADWINLNTLGTACPLIYRSNLFTGAQDPDHIYFSTQDQGTQMTQTDPSGVGTQLAVWQNIGGDGPPLKSQDGVNAWLWQREGKEVWGPATIYNGSTKKTAGSIRGEAQGKGSITLTKNSHIGWIQTYIDRVEGGKRMWLLTKNLERIEWNGSSLSKTTINKGTGNQVTGMAQSLSQPDVVYFLQEAVVYKSTNRGTTFDNGTSTPLTKTTNGYGLADYGGGWVHPTNPDIVLFNGPSTNSVGSILSKDGGATWTDVTGDYPTGADFQTAGVIGSPDGKYVFAGTEFGPWVFVVSEEKWYPLADGAANFNTTDIEFIASENIVRFGTWGSGVWDFKIEDLPADPYVTIASPNGGESYVPGASAQVTWSGYYEGNVSVKLLKNGSSVSTLGTVTNGDQFFNWAVPDNIGSNFKIEVSAATSSVSDESDAVFSIEDPILEVTSPAESSSWILGEQAIISWNSNFDETIQIDLYNGLQKVQTITTLSSSQDSFEWVVDETLNPGSAYMVKAYSLSDASVRVSTPIFDIYELLQLSQDRISVQSVDSEHNDVRSADSTLDGNTSTLWHTEWSPNIPDFPHTIIYEVDTSLILAGFSHLPRQSSENGRIKEYKVEISSDDGATWIEVSQGEFSNNYNLTKVLFDQFEEASLVKFTALSEQNGNAYASMAEFNLFYVEEDEVVSLGNLVKAQALDIHYDLQDDLLTLKIEQEGVYQIKVMNSLGQVYWATKENLTPGAHRYILPGWTTQQQYWLQIKANGQMKTLSIRPNR